MLEQTVFFVKPNFIQYGEEIFQYLQLKLGIQGIPLIQSRSLISIPEEGWMEFYKHLSKIYSEQLKNMASYFAGKNIDFGILAGDNIIRRVKELVGPTRYEENPPWTIRGKWGPYELPHTIVHSSDTGEVRREMNIIKIYGLHENGTKI
jgi:nucleoside diphosphate kinase